MKTTQILLKKRPEGKPDKENFSFESTDVPDLKEGQVRVKGKYYSVDPYMRGRMNSGESYIAPFEVGSPIDGGVVAEVEESKAEQFQKGDLVLGNLPWSEETVAPAEALKKIKTSDTPPSYYLGILGMPGLTAYFGLLDVGKPKSGETVVVSGAAGAVGIIVGQIAKIKGCKVVGIAGGPEKTKLIKDEYGFDEAIDYKSTDDISAAIKNFCPRGVDVYFDNVGGDISDAVVQHINHGARISLCGQIALYNKKETPVGPRLQPQLLVKSALMQGFIISDFRERFPEGIKELHTWISDGKLKFTETVVEGFDKLPDAFLQLFEGGNTGKMIVKNVN